MRRPRTREVHGRWRLDLLDTRDVVRADDDHVIRQPLSDDPASIIAHDADGEQSSSSGLASAASILAEPLVEIPTATSSALAWAMSWRAKIASVPMSLAMAVTLAGSADRRPPESYPSRAAGLRSLETRSFASVAEPPLPKVMSLPPRSSRSATAAAIWEMALVSDSPPRTAGCSLPASSGASSPAPRQQPLRAAAVLAEEGVKEGRTSHVVALFAVLEVDVDRLPEHR